jgi:hypothetical protein
MTKADTCKFFEAFYKPKYGCNHEGIFKTFVECHVFVMFFKIAKCISADAQLGISKLCNVSG